jgi:hypothetical protein
MSYLLLGYFARVFESQQGKLLTASFSEHDPHRMVHTYGLHKGPRLIGQRMRPSASGSVSMQPAVDYEPLDLKPDAFLAANVRGEAFRTTNRRPSGSAPY